MAVSVIEEAQSTNLVTLDSVKTYLGVTDSSQDNALSALIIQASAEFNRYLGRPLPLQRYHERQRLTVPMPGLRLARGPVAAIQSITVDGVAWQPLDEFDVDRRRASIMATAFIPAHRRLSGPSVVDIEYTAGYVLPGMDQPEGQDAVLPVKAAPLPANIAAACLSTILMLSLASGRDPLLKSESVQGVGNTAWQSLDTSAGAISPDAIAALSSETLAAEWMA